MKIFIQNKKKQPLSCHIDDESDFILNGYKVQVFFKATEHSKKSVHTTNSMEKRAGKFKTLSDVIYREMKRDRF